MKKEIWKDIPGWEGYYQASTLGNIRSVDRIQPFLGPIKGRVLKQASGKAGRYRLVSLCKDGTQVTRSVHGLVAKTFLPNPNGYNCINHKDENTYNNNVDNLEWCTPSYNNSYNNKFKRYCKEFALRGQQKHRRAVMQYEKGVFIKEYKSATDAANKLGICQSGIIRCCNGQSKTCGGFEWKHSDGLGKRPHSNKVVKIDRDGNVVCEFDSVIKAAKDANYNVATFRVRLKNNKPIKGMYNYKYAI